MAIGEGGATHRRIRTLLHLGAVGDLPDGQLLERFASGPGEAAELAFAALVERHGPMVLRVCRGILADPHDAEDAFQATFLVLIRRGRGLWVRDSLGPWLHRVAHRAATGARSAAARRRRLEREAARPPGEDRPEVVDDLGGILHEEVERLPERYRAPVVLCDLEGRTHEQAARHLGWPIGTVKSRLSRARERLRSRLARRGIGPDPGRPVVIPPIPPGLAQATARILATRAIAPGSVATLAQGVYRSMILAQWSKAVPALLALGLGATASGFALVAQEAPRPAPRPADPPAGVPTITVEPGKLQSSLVEPSGVVELARVADVQSPIEGRTTIIKIAPDGSKVRKGDIVCELDSASLRDQFQNRRIAERSAEDDFKRARLAREVSEYAVQEYVEGTYKMEEKGLESKIEIARKGIEDGKARLERMKRARERMDEALAPRREAPTPGDILADLAMDDHLEVAGLNIARSQIELEVARVKLEVLRKYTKDQTIRQLTAEVERLRKDEHAKQAAWESEKSRAAKVERQVAACTILAPADGQVAHAIFKSPAGLLMVEEGATVDERQKILSVADVDGPMRVVLKVPEAVVDQVEPGFRGRIAVDAIGGDLDGTVESVAPLPDPGSAIRKVYTTRVAIEGRPPGLRPGMRAGVRILLADLDGVLAVPHSALVHSGGKFWVVVQEPGGLGWREVTVGKANAEAVEIRRGLRAGEAVARNPFDLMTRDQKRQVEAGKPRGSSLHFGNTRPDDEPPGPPRLPDLPR